MGANGRRTKSISYIRMPRLQEVDGAAVAFNLDYLQITGVLREESSALHTSVCHEGSSLLHVLKATESKSQAATKTCLPRATRCTVAIQSKSQRKTIP
jgi:hypothetical protein